VKVTEGEVWGKSSKNTKGSEAEKAGKECEKCNTLKESEDNKGQGGAKAPVGKREKKKEGEKTLQRKYKNKRKERTRKTLEKTNMGKTKSTEKGGAIFE